MVTRVKELKKELKELFWDEELVVGLLVNITILRSPSMFCISGWHSINSRLRVYCEQLVKIHLDEWLHDGVCLRLEGALCERELSDLTLQECYKERGHVRIGINLSTPELS